MFLVVGFTLVSFYILFGSSIQPLKTDNLPIKSTSDSHPLIAKAPFNPIAAADSPISEAGAESQKSPVKSIVSTATLVPQVQTIETVIAIEGVSSDDIDLFNSSSADVDFKTIARKLRVYKSLFDNSSEPQPSAKIEFLNKVETDLFAWSRLSFNSTLEMRKSFHGSGIVICVSNHLTKIAMSTLTMIREVHHSNLPFEVFYTGDGDLSIENRLLIETVSNTTTRDITKIFNNDELQISGWAIKGFALLASSFENAMLIDADVVFLQSPDVLFYSHIYKTHGALFFHDRSLYSHEAKTKEWFRSLMPDPPSPYSQSLRVFKDKTAHEQESGVVLINKRTNMPGLLATCTLNVGKIRSLAYSFVFGDKETFWLGFETVQEDYKFNGFLPGTIGQSKKTKEGKSEICGRQLLHVDEQQVPTWINGGIAESKYDSKSPLVKLEQYVMEPGEWTLHAENVACLVIDREPIAVSQLQRGIATRSGEIFLKIRG